jgi:rSAM/selenodomain-associated transferase 1
MSKERLLIIFVKNPLKGKVKTRLAKTIGEDKALLIYQELLMFTNKITAEVKSDKAVFYSDFIDQQDLWDSSIYKKHKQEGDNLGDRMYRAFEDGFSEGYQNIVIIGSDCLELSSDLIHEAFEKLREHDFVIGPASDGGYYLLGMKDLHRNLFENKAWSTSSVFEDTMKSIDTMNATCYTLPVLSDVDIENDLKGKLL